ncbi:MAG: recombination-associated protein RdgC [Sumerlaeia bacterium]
MPFRQGALSVRRYILQTEPPEGYERTATMAIRRYLYRPINADRGERESFGWVNPRRPLLEKFTWEDLADGPLVFLGVRRDRKAVSPALFKARKEELFLRVKEERGVERISRQQRLALEEQLTNEMLKETSPTVAFTELVWDRASGEVLMGSTSKTLCERMADLFFSTFDVRLVPQFPALIGHGFMAEQGLEDEYQETGASAAPAPSIPAPEAPLPPQSALTEDSPSADTDAPPWD